METSRITTSERKLIKSLYRAKGRRQAGLFLVEGAKAIAECFSAFRCQLLVANEEEYSRLLTLIAKKGFNPSSWLASTPIRLLPTSYDFSAISMLNAPQGILALFALPSKNNLDFPLKGATLLLDQIQDPGNLGTIIRTADWFGVANVITSSQGADPFSPKAIQASMGSIAHIAIHSLSQEEITRLLATLRPHTPIIGTFLEGESLFSSATSLPKLSEPSILIMGNEGNGISDTIASYTTQRVTIPSLAQTTHGESLNVATATAILLTALHLAR